MNGRKWAYEAWKILSSPGRYPLTQAVFLRVLGLAYLAAFASLRPQMRALFGAHGIVSAAQLLTEARTEYGSAAFGMLPTVFWLGCPDGCLEGICLAGSAAAILMITGFFSRAAAVICWVFYLSIVSVGAPFTNFQWDALLLESGFLAMFAGAPWLVWGYRVLLFRLMFESGVVKLTSGDVNWRDFHALHFHFFTQPLPTPLAWYAHHLPPSILDALTLAVLATELAVPFLLFFPRHGRQTGTVLLIILQLAILLTGNYGFFNLLTLALCLWGFDDVMFRSLANYLRIRQRPWPKWQAAANAAVAAIILLGILQLLPRGTYAGSVQRAIAPFEIVNSYGLFAVMTTTRQEIVLQGSNDGVEWRDYEFYYKPGNLHRTLPLTGTHMPRLDWQMWFAALGTFGENRWFGGLMYRLLVGEPQVTALLETPPFARPPHYLRAQLYDYTFSGFEERRLTGAVWRRELRGIWYGPVSLTGR